MLKCMAKKKLSRKDIQMISYIKGLLEIKAKDYVVVDVGGIGYKIFM